MSRGLVLRLCLLFRFFAQHRAAYLCNNARGQASGISKAMRAPDFDEIVERALRNIPARFRNRMNNVAVVVEDEPAAGLLRERGVSPGGTLLGLYQGRPLTQRSVFEPFALPDRITVFQ